MTKYLIFIFEEYEPGHGLEDLTAVADTLEEAKESVRLLSIKANNNKAFHITRLNLDDDSKPMVTALSAGVYRRGPGDSEVVPIVYRTRRPL